MDRNEVEFYKHEEKKELGHPAILTSRLVNNTLGWPITTQDSVYLAAHGASRVINRSITLRPVSKVRVRVTPDGEGQSTKTSCNTRKIKQSNDKSLIRWFDR